MARLSICCAKLLLSSGFKPLGTELAVSCSDRWQKSRRSPGSLIASKIRTKKMLSPTDAACASRNRFDRAGRVVSSNGHQLVCPDIDFRQRRAFTNGSDNLARASPYFWCLDTQSRRKRSDSPLDVCKDVCRYSCLCECLACIRESPVQFAARTPLRIDVPPWRPKQSRHCRRRLWLSAHLPRLPKGFRAKSAAGAQRIAAT